MSRVPRLLLALALVAGPAAAQSSEFGVRGLGIPLRPISVRARGTGGAFGLFDAESGLNPASIALVGYVTASFQTVQAWRQSETPAGSASVRDNRFPGILVSGPIGGTPFSLALSASGYTDRNFELASRDTLLLRGAQVEVFDTLISHGGLSDLRAALGWRQSKAVQWGVALHLITGSNRINSRRAFADTLYGGASEQFTMSYLGVGASAGVTARIGRALTLAGMVRADNKLTVERDSASFGTTKLPVTVSGGARLALGDRLLVAGSALYRNWSVADKDLIAQGGIGSVNTTEVNGGLEFLPDPKRPGRRPIRLGAYHASLPFPLRQGDNASETGVSLGSAVRFAGGRATVDFSLERIWRKASAGFSERATLFTLGIGIRP
jgi:hypothetical protein